MADQITCDGPEDCSGATPVCCGVDVGNGQGTFPTCGATSVGAYCTSANNCKTAIAQSCSATQKVQFCHAELGLHDRVEQQQVLHVRVRRGLADVLQQHATAGIGGGTCM